jgi:hypothetical protein
MPSLFCQVQISKVKKNWLQPAKLIFNFVKRGSNKIKSIFEEHSRRAFDWLDIEG